MTLADSKNTPWLLPPEMPKNKEYQSHGISRDNLDEVLWSSVKIYITCPWFLKLPSRHGIRQCKRAELRNLRERIVNIPSKRLLPKAGTLSRSVFQSQNLPRSLEAHPMLLRIIVQCDTNMIPYDTLPYIPNNATTMLLYWWASQNRRCSRAQAKNQPFLLLKPPKTTKEGYPPTPLPHLKF